MQSLKSILLLLTFICLLSAEENKKIYIIEINGIINSIVSTYLNREIENAVNNNAAAIILDLDTPGGLMDPMRDIVKDIINCPLPVIGYVYPDGSRAASAGVFILLACDYIAMSPAGNLGAAHPVMAGNNNKVDETMKEKILNDTLAYIESLAEKNNRDIDLAKKMVSKSISLTSTQALEKKFIDYIATNPDNLIAHLSTKKHINHKPISVNSEMLRIKRTMNLLEQFLYFISHPNIAYILLTLGIIGLIAEFRTPGVGFPGVFGAICFLLAMFALNTLPVTLSGILLILLGIILLIFEINTPTYGILGTGSVLSFLIGSIILVRSDIPELSISLTIILSTTLFLAAFIAFIIYLSINILNKKKKTGLDTLDNLTGYAKSEISSLKKGTVFVNGELWSAFSDSENKIKKGDKVIVLENNSLTLIVKKI